MTLISKIIESKCSLYDIDKLSQEIPCILIEMPEGKTVYCFGDRLFNTYKDVIVVDHNNIENFKFFRYYPKIKINHKQVIFKTIE